VIAIEISTNIPYNILVADEFGSKEVVEYLDKSNDKTILSLISIYNNSFIKPSG
jgi:hypothetical protein